MNKALLGVAILLLFNTIGEIASHYLIPMLPGSIVGMVLLFVALQLKVVKEEWIASLVDTIMKNLPILFLAPAVGVITLIDIIRDDIWGVATALVVSTLAVISVVGLTLNAFTKR